MLFTPVSAIHCARPELPAEDWTGLLAFTNTAPTTNFVDTGATNFNRRFHRVVSP